MLYVHAKLGRASRKIDKTYRQLAQSKPYNCSVRYVASEFLLLNLVIIMINFHHIHSQTPNTANSCVGF